MTCIPARPIVADDPLAYFAALTAPNMRTERPMPPQQPADRALHLMYGYYTVE